MTDVLCSKFVRDLVWESRADVLPKDLIDASWKSLGDVSYRQNHFYKIFQNVENRFCRRKLQHLPWDVFIMLFSALCGFLARIVSCFGLAINANLEFSNEFIFCIENAGQTARWPVVAKTNKRVC